MKITSRLLLTFTPGFVFVVVLTFFAATAAAQVLGHITSSRLTQPITTPVGVPGLQARNLKAVRTAFEIGGIEFLDQTGLRFRGQSR